MKEKHLKAMQSFEEGVVREFEAFNETMKENAPQILELTAMTVIGLLATLTALLIWIG